MENGRVGASVSVKAFIAIPGEWHQRSSASEPWRLTSITPAEIELTRGQSYCLRIAPTAVDDDLTSVIVLVGLRSLEVIDLTNCRSLTDSGLALLHPLKQVKQIKIQGCRQVGLLRRLLWRRGITKRGISTLQQALPECEII